MAPFGLLESPRGIEPLYAVLQAAASATRPRGHWKGFGGVSGARTRDSLLMKKVLYQLSYHTTMGENTQNLLGVTDRIRTGDARVTTSSLRPLGDSHT